MCTTRRPWLTWCCPGRTSEFKWPELSEASSRRQSPSEQSGRAGLAVPIDKVVATFDEAVADVADGSVVHIGGFGGPAEYPSYLIAALARRNVMGLTITGNHSGFSVAQQAMLKELMSSLLAYPDDYWSPG